MKKEKIITRTIESTEVNFKVFSVKTGEVFNTVQTIAGKHDEKECNKILSLMHDSSDEYKFIMINSIEVIEKLYGMPESLFMQYATELPPRKTYEKEEV